MRTVTGSSVRWRSDRLGSDWNDKRKGRAGTVVVPLDPEATSMLLDDRAADEQADPHAAALCAEEGLEY
jgi:hypothetical protein